MKLDEAFLSKLSYLSMEEVSEFLFSENRPAGTSYQTIENEIRPVDLYCYLSAKYGSPNGVQNMLRGDHSENLVHWNWSLGVEGGMIDISGQNYRTAIVFIGLGELTDNRLSEFVRLLKGDFKNYGKEMSNIRKSLEHWVEFVNPYMRLKKSIDSLMRELGELDIYNLQDPLDMPAARDEGQREKLMEHWKETGSRLNRAFGLCFGIRAMLPVMSEAFINIILFVFMRKEIKSDKRLWESAFKEHIDIRVRGMHLKCYGFVEPIDYSNEICGAYHSLINERNDLLHGNVAISKLKFNELYFLEKVPVFKEYKTMWHRAFNTQRESVGLDRVVEELKIVENFQDYILSCMHEKYRENAKWMLASMELGFREETGSVAMLFSGALMDSHPGPQSEKV